MKLPFTLQQLRVLKAIAKEQSFTKAANLLYTSQPALSHQIKILEKNLNTSLIKRTQNRIFLTESGILFLQYSERILSLGEESCRALMDLKNGNRGNLKIATNQSVGLSLLPQILVSLIKNYPQIDLKVQIKSNRLILNNIIKNKIDIAIIKEKAALSLNPELTIQKLISEQFMLTTTKSNFFIEKFEVNKKDLFYLNFIVFNSNLNVKKFLDNSLIQQQIKVKNLNTVLQLNSIESIKLAVKLGLGVAFLPESFIEKKLDYDILKIKGITIKKELFIISNMKNYKSKAFKFFCHELDKSKHF